MTQSVLNWLVYDSVESRAIRHLFDDYFGYLGRLTLLFFTDCGHRFQKAPFNEEQLICLYSDYYPRAQRAHASQRDVPVDFGLTVRERP